MIDLKKKPKEIEPIVLTEETEEQTGPENNGVISGTVQQITTFPIPQDDVNPFSNSDDDASAIEAIQRTIDPDPETLPMIANATNPRANAVGDTVTDYIQIIASNRNAGIKDLATFGKSIIRNCLKHQIGAAGKDNRTRLYLDACKAERAFEQQAELSQSDKAFGKR